MILVQPDEEINRVELTEKQPPSVMKFQGRGWNCNKIGQDKIINVIADSGASCNLMSEHVFHSLTRGKAPLAGCDKNVYAYTHPQPLELKGSCMLRVTVPQTKMSAIAEFYIVPGQAATLLGRKTSEMLAILKVGINVNNCSTNIDCVQPLDNKAALRLKFPAVFEGLEN